jgi:hypothetical protein
VYGEGNVYDYGFRIYNPRLGKFLSVDPLTKSYPWYTPYQFAGNKPIVAIDLDGLEEAVVIKTTYYEGDVLITKVNVLYVRPENRKVNPDNPELGTGGVDYILANGLIERMPTLEPGSPEEKIMKKQMNYIEDGKVKRGTRWEALGKGTNEPSTPIYSGEHFWVVTVSEYPNKEGTGQISNNGIEYVVNQMKKYQVFSAEIIGFTDKDPTDKYINKNDPDGNNKLSTERANDVKKELESKGISSSRINAYGTGSKYADKTSKNPTDRKVIAILYGAR